MKAVPRGLQVTLFQYSDDVIVTFLDGCMTKTLKRTPLIGTSRYLSEPTAASVVRFRYFKYLS
jgi:hypothetical protein